MTEEIIHPGKKFDSIEILNRFKPKLKKPINQII